MILSYNEIKEAVYDSYKSLHDEFNYTPKDTLFATIGEYNFSEDYTKTDEACIYINFTLIFNEKGEDLDFIKDKLIDIINDKNVEYYMSTIGEDFTDFFNDIIKVKEIIQES